MKRAKKVVLDMVEYSAQEEIIDRKTKPFIHIVSKLLIKRKRLKNLRVIMQITQYELVKEPGILEMLFFHNDI